MHRTHARPRRGLLLALCLGPFMASGAGGQEVAGSLQPQDAAPEARGAPCASTRLLPEPCPSWHAGARGAAYASPSLPEPAARRFSRTTTGAAALAASFVAATLLDEQIRESLAAENPDDPAPISRLGNTLGNGRIAVVVTGATYGVARLVGQDELADPAGRVLASLLAAGVANGAMKASLGRARPRLELGPAEFRPFTLDNAWQSFPSGHVTTAFALATAISAEADRPWVTALTFSGATLVAWSRSHEDRHWASDIVGGAAVGTFAAYHTTRALQRRAERRADDRPVGGARLLVGPDRLGLSFPVH
jgi:membrane-associated phospholipid phosphatase